jgi:signal transduction histidine kinase
VSVRLQRLLVGMVLAAAYVVAIAAQPVGSPTPAFDFDSAEFVLSDSFKPPGDDAHWRRVRLPDNWYVSRPGMSGVGWYRMQFDLPPGPWWVHSLYARRGSARYSIFFLNGNRFATGSIQGDAHALNWDEPMRFAISPALLRPGRNVLHVRVDAVADLRQGLASVSVGPGDKVLPRFFARYELQVVSLRMFGGAAFLAAAIAFAYWVRSRRDSAMFWFGVTALAWALMSLPWFSPRFGVWEIASDLVAFPLRFAYAAPLLVLCLRVAGKCSRVTESAIWGFTLSGAVLTPIAGEAHRAMIITTWSVTYLVALVALLTLLVRSRARERDTSFWIFVAAVALVVLLNGCDFARWMGWADYDNLTLAHFHVPLVLFAIGLAIVDRHFSAVDEVARANRELESRVAEKTREIEENFRRLRAAEHEGALSRERSRIMADMHDGVGASLLGLLGMIQSQKVGRPDLERRVHESLQELRLAVDSLEPVDGDLGLVLGNVRHRMRESIEESGVRFVWQVSELPPVDYLTPRTILAIQRVVAEALANALRHSRATTITVSTRMDADTGRLLVRVVDDGAGFDLATVRRGRGLDNLVNRIRGIGGTVEIESAPGYGTVVTFVLPLPGGPLSVEEMAMDRAGDTGNATTRQPLTPSRPRRWTSRPPSVTVGDS